MELKLPPDFAVFLSLLTKNDARYLLIGGFAVGVHGYVRATNDIDVWIEPTVDNAAKTEKALREFGFDLPDLTPEMLISRGKITRMGVPPMRIEILNSISGVSFEEAHDHRVYATANGIQIPVIGLADLIRNKLASGRAKDLADVEELQ